MKTRNVLVAALVGSSGLLLPAMAFGQEETAAPAQNAMGDLAGRWYVSPMYSHTFASGRRHADDADGGLLAIGKQVNPHALFEAYGSYNRYGADDSGDPDAKLSTAGLAVAGFPWATGGNALGGAYGLLGVNWADGKDFPLRNEKYDQNRSGYAFDIGLGYLARLPVVRFASLRVDVRYRMNFVREAYASVDPQDEHNDHPNINDVVASVGLLIPIGAKPEPVAPPAPPPVAVVAPAAVCADHQDNDGDGKIDFPDDPGCASADDGDETDPPQCSNGRDDDGDGLVDFPADKGCAAADDNDETDPCRTPGPGEKVSLKGCGTGDTIVLRGVNFDFDKATLTANAKTILDNVAEELSAYPEIKVELSGHTDAKGSDEYNQKLSERRAASVRKYLESKGIAGDRMTSVGYGESKPVADNETDEGRELNRRVELRVTAGVAGTAAP